MLYVTSRAQSTQPKTASCKSAPYTSRLNSEWHMQPSLPPPQIQSRIEQLQHRVQHDSEVLIFPHGFSASSRFIPYMSNSGSSVDGCRMNEFEYIPGCANFYLCGLYHSVHEVCSRMLFCTLPMLLREKPYCRAS